MLPKLARLAKRDGLFLAIYFYQKIYHYEVKFAKKRRRRTSMIEKLLFVLIAVTLFIIIFL